MSSENFAASLRQWLRDSAWLDKLRGAVDNMPEGDSVSKDSLCFFFDSIDRLNDGIGFLKTFAVLPDDPDTNSLIDLVAGKIHDACHLVFELAANLDALLEGDTPVSHGIAHARSWSRIVLQNCTPISLWIEKGVMISRQHLAGIVYDSSLVSVNLEIEFERILMRWNNLQDAKTEQGSRGKPPANTGQQNLRPCDGKAGSQYNKAMDANPALKTDREAYEWYENNIADDDEEIVSFATWAKYLREYRKSSGTQKNNRGVGNKTRSVVSGADIEFQNRTEADFG